jgi:hypothetical protein
MMSPSVYLMALSTEFMKSLSMTSLSSFSGPTVYLMALNKDRIDEVLVHESLSSF